VTQDLSLSSTSAPPPARLAAVHTHPMVLVPALAVVRALALVLALIVAGCGSGSDGETGSGQTSAPEVVERAESAGDADLDPDPTPTGPPATPEAPDPTPVPTVPPAPSATPPPPTATAVATPVMEPILWEPCRDGECGEVIVPLDHDDPTGATLRLPIAKVAARNPDERIGSLLVNFGGPGAAGTRYLSGFHDTLPAAVRDRFDIVVWDPRGTDGESLLQCPESPLAGQLYDDEDGFADDVELEEARRIDYAACTEVEGLLDNLGSVPTVHDMDLIRRGLGDDKLNYLGYSYGTQLGWMYATLYGANLRSLVLDAPVEPGMHSTEGWLRQMENFDLQLTRLDDLCDDFARQCAVADEGMLDVFERLREELADEPVTGPDGTTFDDADLVSASLQAIYSQPSYIAEFYARGLDRLDQGQPDLLVQLTDSEGFDGYNAITCADGEGIESLTELEAHIEQRYERGDMFESYPDVVLCDEWPARTIPLPEIDTSEAPPTLLVANTEDAATPYVGALELAAAIGSTVDARMIAVQSGGHGAVAGNRCVDELFATYVITLELPPFGMRCYEDGSRLGLGIALGEQGAEVVRVDAGSYADAAGMLIGDQILTADGVDLRGGGDIPFFELGTDVPIVVERDGEEIELTLATLRAPWTS